VSVERPRASTVALVSFVNQGPGDPALRSPRASERLSAADVVIDDEGPHARALLELAREGKRVVRTMTGDENGDARVLAEAAALARAGIAIEIVPGPSASASAAAFAGVVGRALYVHSGELEGALRGEPADAPVTLIVWPGLPLQRVVVTTAAEATRAARPLGLGRLLVALGTPDEDLRWFERRPLFGKRVLVTRARDQAGSTASQLREHGAEPVVIPTIEIRPPSDPEPLAAAVRALRDGGYAWAVFTSANGVEHVWAAITAAGGDARAFGSVKLAAIGPATARALEVHGLLPDVVAREFRGEQLAVDVLSAMGLDGGLQPGGSEPLGGGPRVLLARAAKARDVLPEALRDAGCRVDVVAAYETHASPEETAAALASELEAGRIDAVTFTSSSTVENLCDRLGPRSAGLLQRTRVASIGPITTATAQARGLRVDVTAARYTVPGLIEALAQSYA
jgi:uroporphyrinogen III methyltransferase/synthase